MGLELRYHAVGSGAEIERAFESIRNDRCEAVDVYPDAFMSGESARIVRLALAGRMASVSGWSNYPEAGMLMSYGPNITECFRRLSTYVDKILKGAKPATLPVELPSTVEFVVNLRTARALKLVIPPTVLARADRVFE